MAKCPVCKSSLYVHKCMQCLHAETPKVAKGVLPCEWPCTATIHVQESTSGKAIQGVYTRLDGASEATDVNGFRVVEKLAPGSHVAGLVVATLGEKYALPIGQTGADVTKAIAAGENQFYNFTLDPLTALKVVVKRRHDSNGVVGAKVKIAAGKTGNTLAVKEQTTPNGGEVTFKKLRQDTYKLDVELDDPAKKKFELESEEEHHVLDMGKNPDEHVFWARLVIHLKLKYLDPDKTVRFFPKDFPVTVAFAGDAGPGETKDIKVLDDAGYIKFDVDSADKKKFTLKFDSGSTRYLVHEDGKPHAELRTDPTDADLFKLGDAGKQFFGLPKAWALAQSNWTAKDVVVPTDGQIVVPADGIGTSDVPAELTLKPKLLHARFEFFDRKYGHDDHNKRPVNIPSVLLKGVREAAADGTPQNPVAGTHDTISNWMMDKADNARACQCLPWIITKTTAGVDLPKFNNKLMLEFGRDDAFVHSTGPAARKIVVLPSADPKRKPSPERIQYYDLPKVWKSKCYFTRFHDKTKNRFFDELADVDDADLEAASNKHKRLMFSLDDVVLVSGASQDIKDKTEATGDGPGGTEALSEHSRITILTIDRTDKKYKVVVHKPQPKAVYWSREGFQKETGASVVRRNVITDVPVNPRVVVFCSDFFDIYDKRTETAVFTNKEILGARAAKFEDTDISSRKVLLSGAASVTSGYVGYEGSADRSPRIHYLHYCDVDGATMYGAVVGYWSARFVLFPTGGSTNADLTTFRDKGLALAMKRWNDKDCYFEENDDKTDLRVKHFCLFEAKGVETAPGAFTDTGGKHVCEVRVRDNAKGSAAAVNGSWMRMRIGGAKDEGESWGSAVGTLPAITTFEGRNAHPKCAFGHELGHSAWLLYDSYLTGSGQLCETGDSDKELSDELCGYENFDPAQKNQQEYYGMPYELDTGAMMFENRADTRLRYFWLRANWLNDQAQPAGADKLPEFLAGRRFRAAYEATGKPKLKYHRADAERLIYAPSTSAFDHTLANHGKCDLHLYKLGDDEFARVLRGGPYNGILVISMKLCVKFEGVMTWAKKAKYFVGDVVKNGASFYTCKTEHLNKDFDAPADWDEIAAFVNGTVYNAGDRVVSGGDCFTWSGTAWESYPTPLDQDQQIAQMQDLNARVKDLLADAASVGKFKLYGSGSFSPALMRVLMHWSHETDPGGAQFTLTYSPESKAFQPDGANLKLGASCDASTVIRYLFGKVGDDPLQWGAQGLTGNLVRADLKKFSDWMDGNAGGNGYIVAENP